MALFGVKELTYDEVKKKVDASRERKVFFRKSTMSDSTIKKLEAEGYRIIIQYDYNKTNITVEKSRRW